MWSLLLFSTLQTMFGIQFLDQLSDMPKTGKILIVLLFLLLILQIPMAYLDKYLLFFVFYIVIMMPIVGILLFAGIYQMVKGHFRGWIFIASWSFVLLGGVIYMIKATGYLPSNLVTENAFIIGNLFQIMVLGIGVVSNRTAELELANIKLQELSHKDALTGLYNRSLFEEPFEVQRAFCIHQYSSSGRRHK